jgi:hypothetical protein
MNEDMWQPLPTIQPAPAEQAVGLPLEVLLRRAERDRSAAAAKSANAKSAHGTLQTVLANLLKT